MKEKGRRLIRSFAASLIAFLVVACDVKTLPPTQIQEADLVGLWQTEYSRTMLDTIEPRSDGTFKQLYVDRATGYAFGTGWNLWWMERLPDGLVRIHLEGAKYFLASPKLRSSLYDPYTQEYLRLRNQLVLHVRIGSDGELLLEHVWTSSDEGFPIFGQDKSRFRRVPSH